MSRISTTNSPSNRDGWAEVTQLREIGAFFYSRGWSVGTSSNYSMVLSRQPLQLLLTASGKHKGKLTPADFVVVDESGKAIHAEDPKPSAETMIHCILASRPDVGSVLHTHSVWGTLLSEHFGNAGGLTLSGFEMLKGLRGVSTHEHAETVPIYENTQDIPTLAHQIARDMNQPDTALRHGFLIRGHGLYTWGTDAEEAFRHVEIFEFLFEVVGRSLMIPNSVPIGVTSF